MRSTAELRAWLSPDSFGRGTFLGDDPTILDLTPGQRLLVSAWRHACPRPIAVAEEYGLDWTRRRYDECNFVFGLICEHVKKKPELYRQLVSPVKRLPGERVGVFEQGRVPISYKEEMSPLSTIWGYALPRIFIEQAGREEERTIGRYFRGIDLLDQAIDESKTPIELLISFAEKITKRDADKDVVLGHIFEPEVMKEEQCFEMQAEISRALRRLAPRLWRHYFRT